MSNIVMLQAELNQARQVAAKAMQERETYVRLVAILAQYVTNDETVPTVDGNLVVMAERFREVPEKWVVNVVPTTIKASDDPNAEDLPCIVVEVKMKPPVSPLFVPNGRI